MMSQKEVINKKMSQLALVSEPAKIENADSWTIETGGHRGAVHDLSYSPDNRFLASAGIDGSIRIWDSETGRLEHVLIGHNP